MKFYYLSIIFTLFIIGAFSKQNSSIERCNADKKCPLKKQYKNSQLTEEEFSKDKYYQCCSHKGYCGESIEFCGKGCQFGDCITEDKEQTQSITITTTVTTTTTTTTTTSTSTTTPTPTIRIKPGMCGPNIGECEEGYCCSKFGWCGTTLYHCFISRGCQPEFGICIDADFNTITVDKSTTTTTTTTTTENVSKETIATSVNGKCGEEYGKCPEGQCCSKHGWCGIGSGYCAEGCQSEFGECKN